MEIIMSLHSSQKWLCIERLSIAVTAASALICMFPLPAFAANPIEELAKQKGAVGGGIDPHGDSWLSMQHSLEQFLHPEFMLRLFLNLLLAVACAWVIAWHPRSSRIASLSDLEGAEDIAPSGHGRCDRCGIERNQPNTCLCHFWNWGAHALSNRTR